MIKELTITIAIALIISLVGVAILVFVLESTYLQSI